MKPIITIHPAGQWHTVGLDTPEQIAAFRAADDTIHDGAWSARGKAKRGEITEAEAQRLIDRARLQRRLRRSRSRR